MHGRRSALLCLSALVAVAAACDREAAAPEPPARSEPPARIEAVSDTAPMGTLGAVAAESVSVRVTDADGIPVKDAVVTWTVVAGGGSAPASSRTGGEGIAAARWTLGFARKQRLQATVEGLAPVAFSTTRELIATHRSSLGDVIFDSVIVFDPDREERRAFASAPGLVYTGIAPTWSSAGDLAYTAAEYVREGLGTRLLRSVLWRVRPGASVPEQVTQKNARNLSWSPDARRIVYEVYPQIRIVDADGSGDRELVAGGVPRWLADDRIFYTSPGITGGTWSIRPDGTGATQVSALRGVPSPDGTRLVVARDIGTGNIPPGFHFALYVVNVNGTGEVRITSQPVHELGNVTWSPDGTRVAYTGNDQGLTLELFVSESDGSGTRLLANSNENPQALTWSPDGDRIAFGGWEGMYVVDADGTGLRVLEFVGTGSAPAWRP